MSAAQFQKLFGHHCFTTGQMLAFAAKLEPKDYFEHPGFGHGSIYDLLFHLLSTDPNRFILYE